MRPTRTQSLTILALIVITFGLIGCGSDDNTADAPEVTTTTEAESPTTEAVTTTPATTPEPDACALVTKAEAEQLTGTPLDAPVAVKATCTYTGPVTGPTAQVEVFVGDGAKKFLDTDRDTLEHEFTEVPGIGDEALQEEGVIFFNKGGTWVSIRLTLLNDPAENVVPLQTAAKAAAGRM